MKPPLYITISKELVYSSIFDPIVIDVGGAEYADIVDFEILLNAIPLNETIRVCDNTLFMEKIQVASKIKDLDVAFLKLYKDEFVVIVHSHRDVFLTN